jgi:hypothetical protein
MSSQFPIPRNIRLEVLEASASQTVFGPFDWLAFDDDDVVVMVEGDEIDPADYVIAPAAPYTALPALFTVTFGVGIDAGDLVVIAGRRTHERQADVTQGGVVNSLELEKELDRQTVVLQEARRDLDTRAALAPLGEEIGELPALLERAGKVAAWDSEGNFVAMEVTTDTEAAAAAAASAAAAAASYDSFDDRYLGAKGSDPATDNDGAALLTGALYWNTPSQEFRVWNGGAWEAILQDLADLMPGSVHVRDYGATPDCQLTTDTAALATTSTVTSASNPWALTDIGKVFELEGAGAAGALYVGTITARPTPGSVTVSPAISTTVAGVRSKWYTDFTDEFNAAIADCPFGGKVHGAAGFYAARVNLTNRCALTLCGPSFGVNNPIGPPIYPGIGMVILAPSSISAHEAIVDRCGAAGVRLQDLQVGHSNDPRVAPAGILDANSATRAATLLSAERVYVEGRYSDPAWTNYGVQQWRRTDCLVWNRNTNPIAAFLSRDNVFGAVSTWTTIATGDHGCGQIVDINIEDHSHQAGGGANSGVAHWQRGVIGYVSIGGAYDSSSTVAHMLIQQSAGGQNCSRATLINPNWYNELAPDAANSIVIQTAAGASGQWDNVNIINGSMDPATTGGTINYAPIQGAVIADGDKGDITVGSSGTTLTIDLLAVTTGKIADDAVTNAKAANMAALTIKGNNTSGSADPNDLGAGVINDMLGHGNLTDLVNLTLACSVAGNALTIAIKDRAGADPSATSPVSIGFRSATAAAGTYTKRDITAATALVISSGSTLGFVSGQACRLWVVAFDDAGTVRLGVKNCRLGTQIFPLDEFTLWGSTAEGGAGGADSAGVFYTGTAVTAKAFRILGYLDFTLTTAGTWDEVPDKIQLFGPGVKKPGESVQPVRTALGTSTTATTTVPLDDTIPQITEGDQIMTRDIVPTAAQNVLQVRANVQVAPSAAVHIIVALFQDAVANALAVADHMPTAGNDGTMLPLEYWMLAGTVATITFRIRVGPHSAGTITVNGLGGSQLMGGVFASFLAAEEIMA